MSAITDVPGVLVGHHTDTVGVTGCTVIRLPKGSTGSYALVGGAPGTRDTELLHPARLVDEIHAFVLTGGSAFGLATADGVVSFLEAQGVGLAFAGATVPIVPAAVIFDLAVGDPKIRPGPADGAAAAEAAGADVEEGSVGAGTGATVGKWAGNEHAMKGGLGAASAPVGDTGVIVGAVVVCNAMGDVLDERGELLAGARTDAEPAWGGSGIQSTVLACVATNAKLDKPGCATLARMAAAGITRCVRPVHTPYDGDLVFSAATGEVELTDPVVAGAVGAEVVATALRRGVRGARGLGGVPGLADRR